MRHLLLVLALSLAGILMLSPAKADQCYGSVHYQSCINSAGDYYTVHRYGITTKVYGFNPSTGSTWNESITTVGNTTYYNGTRNGHAWNMQLSNFGRTTVYNGGDSRGHSFSYTCSEFGGCIPQR